MGGVTFKHCPFCGGQAVLSETGITTLRYHIECTTCPCTMEGFTSKEQALEIWNKRQVLISDIEKLQKDQIGTFEEQMKKLGMVVREWRHDSLEPVEKSEEVSWEA